MARGRLDVHPGERKPVDPQRDQYEWKALLAKAGVREARLHDARHNAATTLLLPGPGTSRDVCHEPVQRRSGQAVPGFEFEVELGQPGDALADHGQRGAAPLRATQDLEPVADPVPRTLLAGA